MTVISNFTDDKNLSGKNIKLQAKMCFVRYSITIEPVIIISSPNLKAYMPYIVSVGRQIVGDTWCKILLPSRG